MLGKGCLVVLLTFSMTKGFCQSAELVNQPKKLAPFVVVLYDGSSDYYINQVKNYQDFRGTSLLILESAQLDLLWVSKNINSQLNKTPDIDIQRCYLLIVGNRDLKEHANLVWDSPLFTSKYFVDTDLIEDSISSETYSSTNPSLEAIILEFTKSYLWQVSLDEIRLQNVSDLNANSIEMGIGPRVSIVVPFYDGIQTNIKPMLSSFSLSLYRRWGIRWQTNLDMTLSMNLPNQNQIQSQVQEARFAEEEEIDIQAHILRSVGLETRYLFNSKKSKLNPYAGLRAGVTNLQATETTLELDTDNISPSGFDGLDFESLNTTTVSISGGVQYNATPGILIETGLRWSHDLNKLSGANESFFHNLSLHFGLNFRFTGKKILFYDYIRNPG